VNKNLQVGFREPLTRRLLFTASLTRDSAAEGGRQARESFVAACYSVSFVNFVVNSFGGYKPYSFTVTGLPLNVIV